MLFDVKVNITEDQKAKICRAIKSGTGTSIHFSHSDLVAGEHIIGFTRAQINKLKKACQNSTGVTIKLSHSQLKKNESIQGGFIGALLPLLATAGRFLLSSVLPSLATGALASAGSKIVDKISGNGILYMKKGGIACKIRPAGDGLFVSPWRTGNSVTASGLYLKTGSSYVDGRGLLLGPNSPFANIPILRMLL